jgi:dTDP-4-amino-4,6-dideoxygalactose transaminase
MREARTEGRQELKPRWRDLVEEFWDEDVLEACREQAPRVRAEHFLDALRLSLGASGRFWAAPSARVALREFLECVIPRGRRVLVCSLNCGVVAEAVQLAGLGVDTYDLSDTSGRLAWDEVAEQFAPSHAALLVSHLFGVPTDFRGIRAIAAARGVLIIEDCAQTVGASIDGHTAGTLGDAAIFSFNYDKPLSLAGGGALLVNNPALQSSVRPRWRQPELRRDDRELRGFLHWLDRRRTIGGSREPVARSWVRRLATTAGQAPFRSSGIGPLRAALGLWQLEHYEEVVLERNARADLFARTTGCSWYVGPGVAPAWLKQKAEHPWTEAGPRVAAALRRAGLPVGSFNWPITIDERLGETTRPNARHVARYSFDIPIHQNVSWAELQTMCDAFAGPTASPSR